MATALSMFLVFGSAAIFAEGTEVTQAMRDEVGQYWGHCDPYDRDHYGCKIVTGQKCNDYLSPGPKNATLEIVVGNLPPSTEEQPVHLHYFAAREAPGFNPVAPPPHDYKIYDNWEEAYPNFFDPDFNGGNVRVNETGHATLRLYAPATYVMCKKYVRWPHLKIRLCTGEDFIVHRAESLEFRDYGIKVHACGGKDDLLTVERFSATAHPMPEEPRFTSTLPKVLTKKTTTFMTTTPAPVAPMTKTAAEAAPDDSFDWDALEYSPVYQCLLKDLVYDHFASKCAENCPADTDLKHGQCVRPDTMETDAEFDMSWDLKVNCDEKCWEAKKSRSMHDLRLAVADHLDIPFQEVLKVVLRPSTETGRRLSHHHTDAHLYIGVTTGRIEAEKGEKLLSKFLTDKTSASQLLGLQVHSIVVPEEKAAAPAADQLDPAEVSDEYAQFYKDSEPQDSGGFSSIPGSPADSLPAGVVIGIAAAVVVLGLLSAVGLWYKKRLGQRNQQNGDDVKGQKVGAPEEDKLHEENKKVEA